MLDALLSVTGLVGALFEDSTLNHPVVFGDPRRCTLRDANRDPRVVTVAGTDTHTRACSSITEWTYARALGDLRSWLRKWSVTPQPSTQPVTLHRPSDPPPTRQVSASKCSGALRRPQSPKEVRDGEGVTSSENREVSTTPNLEQPRLSSNPCLTLVYVYDEVRLATTSATPR